jgi:hypothetical protein
VIRKTGDNEWTIYSHDGKKVLGRYTSKTAAEKREKEIEAFKHMEGYKDK